VTRLGTLASADVQQHVKGPVSHYFAEQDLRGNATWSAYEEVLKSSEADYKAHFYVNAQHGFHKDSTSRYSPVNAELS
jgi:carboxymethylenebutenolidase